MPNNKNKNLELAVQYIKEANGMGADIVLFPEMWSNGYAPPFDGAFDNPTDPAFEKERKEWLENAVTIESNYVASIERRPETGKMQPDVWQTCAYVGSMRVLLVKRLKKLGRSCADGAAHLHSHVYTSAKVTHCPGCRFF